MAQVPWSENEKDTLVKYWLAGLPVRQIRPHLNNRSKNSILGQAHRMGLEPRVKDFKLDEREMVEFKSMWMREEPVRDIQRRFSVQDKQQIYYFAMRNGMPSRQALISRRQRAEALAVYKERVVDSPSAPPVPRKRTWFEHYDGCGAVGCKYLAVPTHTRCFVHAV